MQRLKWLGCLATILCACTDEEPAAESEVTSAVTKLPASANPYTLFESLQVRPLALSPSGKLLFAVNTPDNRLEIFRNNKGTLTAVGSVSVGLEPVAVAARSENEVWVVNHLSDSVSIVKLDSAAVATVTRTLLVGDEPRDIVFAGAKRDRAFITTAHRGQNMYAGDSADLHTSSKGRADVWVFDANNLGSAAGGTRLNKLTFFADTPRALAVSGNGSKVYAAAFASGNQTTVVSPYAVSTLYGGVMPGPATIEFMGLTIRQPVTGLIVKYSNGAWLDPYGKAFNPFVKLALPDKDVFAIDANANPPVAIESGVYPHVGTTLFNMAVNPVSGKVYVTNTEAHNHVRFEGHEPGFTTVRGRIADSRITVIDPVSGTVTPRDLNPHVDFTQDGNPAEKAKSVAFPQDIVISKDGSTIYTVAQGSQKLAIYSTAEVEAGTITPSVAKQVTLSGGGPTGVVLDEANKRAFVLTRFDNSISIVNTASRTEVGKVKMFNPEPESVTLGRKFLYDANLTSQHGTTACSSCHIGGDKDELAWDLGHPGGIPLTISTAVADHTVDPAVISALLPVFAPIFKFNMPLKGPMTTQSLRGMANHGAMHWRGDRNGLIQQNGAPFIDPATQQPVVSAQPDKGIYDEVKAFTSFNVAFPGLLGSASELSQQDMMWFTQFILQATYPPNPIRNLDNSLTAEQKAGRDFYFNHLMTPNGAVELPSDRFFNCNGCHVLDRDGNKQYGVAKPGFFGSSGKLSFENEAQIFKVPHLRNMYTKVGMFGSSPDTLQPGTVVLQTPQFGFTIQDQVRGFGFQHEGALGSLEHFFTSRAFLWSDVPVPTGPTTSVPPNPFGIPFIDAVKSGQNPPVIELVAAQFAPTDVGGFALRKSLAAFMLAFDSNEAPIVGQQITLTKDNAASAGPRVDLLAARARAGECDLVAKSSSLFSANGGFLYAAGAWQPATTSLPPLPDSALRQLVGLGWLPPVTFTCVPVGSGSRVAIDRDGDGYADWDEILRLKNPADRNSHP